MVVEWERARDQSLLDAITFEKMLMDGFYGILTKAALFVKKRK
jgi:hypothetical protein